MGGRQQDSLWWGGALGCDVCAELTWTEDKGECWLELLPGQLGDDHTVNNHGNGKAEHSDKVVAGC